MLAGALSLGDSSVAGTSHWGVEQGLELVAKTLLDFFFCLFTGGRWRDLQPKSRQEEDRQHHEPVFVCTGWCKEKCKSEGYSVRLKPLLKSWKKPNPGENHLNLQEENAQSFSS